MSESIVPDPADKKQPSADAAPDPFDLDALRKQQDFRSATGVKKTPKARVRKPAKEWWIMTHPDSEYRIEGCVIELKEENEIYWVAPQFWPELAGEPTFGPRALFTFVTRQGDHYIWPIRLPGEDGKLDDWNQSALDYARQTGIWQRVAANKQIGEYDQYTTVAQWPDPVWPDLPFSELLKIAFKGHVIDSVDHPVIKQLRGESK